MLLTLQNVKTSKVFIKMNAKEWPKEYSCNFLEPGLVSYEDVGAGIALLKKETILKALKSMVGKPVLIDHKDVTPKNFERHAVGLVSTTRYDDFGEWAWANFILTDDEAKEVVSKGYSVSCAFDVKATGAGGEWHAIKYDEEITDLEFTHLALVENPRYEECKIYVNSKGATVKTEEKHNKQKEVRMFGLFKKKENKSEKEKIDVSNIFIDIDGKKVPMMDLINSRTKKENDKEMVELSLEDEVELEGGDTVKISELVAAYNKKNDEDKDKEKEEKDADKKKQDAKCTCDAAEGKPHKADCPLYKKEDDKKKDDDKKKEADKKKDDDKKTDYDKKKDDSKEEEEGDEKIKRNVKYFVKLNSLKHQAEDGDEGAVIVQTTHDRLNRGKDRYGSKEKK